MNNKLIATTSYLFLSTIITWWFINKSPLYHSSSQKVLSAGIAGAKWAIQLSAAFLVLGKKKWDFINRISMTCFTGSLILLPFIFGSLFFNINNDDFFFGSLLVSVAVMIVIYALSVRNAGLNIRWWFSWLISLAIAIALQVKFVFDM